MEATTRLRRNQGSFGSNKDCKIKKTRPSNPGMAINLQSMSELSGNEKQTRKGRHDQQKRNNTKLDFNEKMVTTRVTTGGARKNLS